MMRIEYQSVWQTAPRDGGFYGIQPDYYGEGDAGGRDLEIILPFGLFGRPADADTDDGGQVKVAANTLTLYDGSSEAFAMPCGDPRYVGKLPDPGKGGGGLGYGVIDGETMTPAYIMFAGVGISVAPGSLVADVPYEQGQKHHKLEIIAGGSIKITHGDGFVFEITAEGMKVSGGNIELGGSGGNKLLVDNGFTDWLTDLVTKAKAAGIPLNDAPSITADKATAI